MNYVVIGSALAGNKGASAMLESLVQNVTKADQKAVFTLFSLYPKEDQDLNEYINLRIISTKPVFLAILVNSLCILYKLLPPLRGTLRKQKHISALSEADAFIDQGGITFVDGRELYLLYNIASILPGILVTKKTIKCSQALGPFNKTVNNFFAKLVLPKISLVLTRGKITESYTKQIGLNNTKLVADYAFSLQLDDKHIDSARSLLKKYKVPIKDKGRPIIIAPSQVMKKMCDTQGKDYAQIMADFINKIATTYIVVLLAHSAREAQTTHNNDLPLCRQINSLVTNNNFIFIDEVLSAQELRYIIGQGELLVTSRFHAMVSGLVTTTPIVIAGWNHKYREVMDMFDIKVNNLSADNLSAKELESAFQKIYDERSEIRSKIKKNLPAVQQSSALHTSLITELVKS